MQGRGVKIDDDHVCEIQIDRSALNHAVSSIKKSFMNILKTDVAAHENTLLKMQDLSEIRPTPVNPSTISLPQICNHMGKFFSPRDSSDISKILKQYPDNPIGKKATTIIFKVIKNALGNFLSENKKLNFGSEQKLDVSLPFDSITIPKSTLRNSSDKPTDTKDVPGTVSQVTTSTPFKPDKVVGCMSRDSPIPTLCNYEQILDPIALCKSVPEDLSYVRKIKEQLDLMLNYEQSIFKEILATLKTLLKKLGESNTSPEFKPDRYYVPDSDKEENCLDLKLELLKDPIEIPEDDLITPSEAEKFQSRLSKLSDYLKNSQDHLNSILASPLSSSDLALIPEIDRISDLTEILTTSRMLLIQLPLALILLFGFSIIAFASCKIAIYFIRGGEERAHERIERNVKAQYEAPPYQN